MESKQRLQNLVNEGLVQGIIDFDRGINLLEKIENITEDSAKKIVDENPVVNMAKTVQPSKLKAWWGGLSKAKKVAAGAVGGVATGVSAAGTDKIIRKKQGEVD